MKGNVAGAVEGAPRRKSRKLSPLSRTRMARLKADAEAYALVAHVARLRGVSLTAVINGARGAGEVALARQMSMYVLHVLMGRTQQDIGNLFGRERTTVSYACQTIEWLRDERRSVEADLAAIEAEGWAMMPAREMRHAA